MGYVRVFLSASKVMVSMKIWNSRTKDGYKTVKVNDLKAHVLKEKDEKDIEVSLNSFKFIQALVTALLILILYFNKFWEHLLCFK